MPPYLKVFNLKSIIAGLSHTGSIIEWLVMAAGRLSSWALLFMAIVVTGDVLARFVIGKGTIWAGELTGYLLVLAVMLGLAYTLKERGHIRILFLIDRLSQKVQNWFNLIASVVFLGYTIYLCLYTSKFFVTSVKLMSHSDTAWDVVIWPAQFWLPVGFALVSLLLIANIYNEIKVIISNQSPPSEETLGGQ